MWSFVAVAVLVAAVGAATIYRRATRPHRPLPPIFSLSPLETVLEREFAPLLARHSGKTGLRLLTDNVEAFALRVAAARKAERSLDFQYYYWKDDLTGGLLAGEVIKAADRGVRVRLLLDDVNAWGRDSNYRALDRHPNIEVRLFNPLRNREGVFLRSIEMVLRCWSLNRRMHHKACIVDGRMAIVGGRNIGDAYFDASEASNFRDMDLLVLGPTVQEVQEVFDRYWTCALVAPIRSLPVWSRRADLSRLRQRLEKLRVEERAQPYQQAVRSDKAAQNLLSEEAVYWTETALIVSDPPEKASSTSGASRVLDAILPALNSAAKTIEITSPYFIPLESGARLLLKLAAAGVSISVLTNSLAATDVTAVHGAYSRFRKALLAGGIRIFELRARDARKDVSLLGSRGASLHTKAFVVDGRIGFVGSFNFDPRSVSLNTEMGLLFEQPDLAQAMRDVFAKETAEKRSYRLVLAGGSVRWRDGNQRMLDQEPDASFRRRLLAGAISLLPLESQL